MKWGGALHFIAHYSLFIESGEGQGECEDMSNRREYRRADEQKMSNRLWGVVGVGVGIGIVVVFLVIAAIGYFFIQKRNASLLPVETAVPAVVEELAEAELPPSTDTAVPPTAPSTETAVAAETAVPPTPAATATFLPPPPAATPALVGSVTAFTNIYTIPNDEDSKIAVFATDTAVVILGRPPQGRWVLMQANGVTGYGSADYVKLPQGVTLDVLPIQAVTPAATKAASSATTAVATNPATIFPAPRNSGTAGKPYVPVGGEVEVSGRDESGAWLYVEDKSGHKGYVWGAFFTYGGQIDQLPVITPAPPTATATIAAPTPAVTAAVTITATAAVTGTPTIVAPPSTAAIAYWQEMDGTKKDVGGGMWAVDLLVYAPSGGSYVFSVNGDLEVTAVHSPIASPHEGYDSYVVTISGMGCAGALANDFYVKRGGQELEVRNEYTNNTGAIYVGSPGC